MRNGARYGKVSITDDPDDDDDGSTSDGGILNGDDDDETGDDDFGNQQNQHQMMVPLEISTSSAQDENGSSPEFIGHGADPYYYTLSWRQPWFLSVPVLLLVEPIIIIGYAYIFYDLTGRIWTMTLFLFHLLVVSMVARHALSGDEKSLERLCSRFFLSLVSWMDILLFGIVYPQVCDVLSQGFFTELDGTDVIEYSFLKKRLSMFRMISIVIAVARFSIGVIAWLSRMLSGCLAASSESSFRCLPIFFFSPCFCLTRPCQVLSMRNVVRLRFVLSSVAHVSLAAASVMLVWSLFSLAVHFLPPSSIVAWQSDASLCDPLDDTECAFPYPSFHHMRPDNTTVTGWRVNLRGDVLPPLRGGIPMHMDFCNELDGFSTMAPMLFYMQGLKEAHEAGANQLQGQRSIAKSITADSVTLLIDVTRQQLVPHSAEIDYLDPQHPLVLIFPAQPLQHNHHYAVAVVNAKDAHGQRLPPTRGMQQLLSAESSMEEPSPSLPDPDRKYRYITTVIPALQTAADWISLAQDPQALQLLFDFHTVSEESQLTSVRAVRDGVVTQISNADEWSWSEHVRTIRVDDHVCNENDETSFIARTVHAELDVPWFLNGFGPGHRHAFLDPAAVQRRQSHRLGIAKFVVHIPCSLRAAALGLDGAKPLRGVMEFGHGLFYNRHESFASYLWKIAHEEGYVIMAMDWRGMSNYDLLVVVKTLMAQPHLFRAIRDNLIQGYANKYALQHFARHGRMLTMDWFRFHHDVDNNNNAKQQPSAVVPTLNGEPPVFVFYGISQGGILGAGYASLSGPTGLIDRAILGVPGTPFALIMTRSLDFQNYDQIMLLNFQHNRHVRFFLSIIQMGWDFVEASGVLAPPVHEPYPRMLLQAGLGDVIVPTIAAEALARAFNATLLPSSVNDIYGLSRGEAAAATAMTTDNNNNNASDYMGPYVTYTELVYDEEYALLSVDNVFAAGDNGIHDCLRMDDALIVQLKEFVNTGRVIDPCEEASCHRSRPHCY